MKSGNAILEGLALDAGPLIESHRSEAPAHNPLMRSQAKKILERIDSNGELPRDIVVVQLLAELRREAGEQRG